MHKFYRNSLNTLEYIYFFVRVGENCRGFHMLCKEEITKHGLCKSVARISSQGMTTIIWRMESLHALDWDKHFFGCMSVGNVLNNYKSIIGFGFFCIILCKSWKVLSTSPSGSAQFFISYSVLQLILSLQLIFCYLLAYSWPICQVNVQCMTFKSHVTLCSV